MTKKSCATIASYVEDSDCVEKMCGNCVGWVDKKKCDITGQRTYKYSHCVKESGFCATDSAIKCVKNALRGKRK